MTDPSPGPQPGQRLAHYEVVGLIGRGGMGAVYRARDTKLGREVALKLLPRELSGDPERAARFDREARTLASLQHPNVASIYGFEEHEGQRFLVMELVEGEDLSRRMARGPIDPQEATDVAMQIAAGLEAAHEKGIVHRDLKPANVMITPDHEVKILDFGLARAWFGDTGDETDIGASPTITAAMTAAGTILGTAAYMSPEQARGKAVDRRTDIWAFGVIVFEMLTGERLFEGETISDTLAAVLRAEPDWEAFPAADAPLLARVVERCLVRDPRMRLRDIGEARIVLQSGDGASASMFGATAPTSEPVAAPRRGVPVLVAALVAMVAAIAGIGVGVGVLRSSPEPEVLHASLPPLPGTEVDLTGSAPGPATLSPDGRRVAFTARDAEGVTRLYVRDLDRAEPVVVSGTEGAAYPFWSPDGTTVAYFEPRANAGRLRKVSVGGGPPVTICPAENGKGGTWNEDGVILFAPDATSQIHRVAAIGGEPEPITTLGDDENSHRHPRFLPSGREFLFVARVDAVDALARAYVGSLDGGTPRLVTESQTQVEFSQDHLLAVRDDVLLATPFDPGTRELTGGAVPVVENLMLVSEGAVLGAYATTPEGTLVFQRGGNAQERKLEWIDLETGQHTDVGTRGRVYHPKISPDGSTAAVEIYGESREDVDIWLVDLETGRQTRFTFDAGEEATPVWSPDGTQLYYVARSGAESRVLRRPIDGTVDADELWRDESFLRLSDVTHDGASLLLSREDRPGDEADVIELALDGSGETRDVVVGEARATGGVDSPDGRWLVYYGDSKAFFDVFVTADGGGPRKWQVTTEGGTYPLWSPDGTRLYVSDFDGDFEIVEVDGSGSGFRIGERRTLTRVEPPTRWGNPYDVHPDGRRLLQATAIESGDDRDALIEVVTDWQRALVR